MAQIETKSVPLIDDYKAFVTDLVQQQMLIIGPQIALDKANDVMGLTVDNKGKATIISGDAYMVVKDLIDGYSLLSYQVTHAVLCRLIDKHPIMKEEFKKAIVKIELTCPIEL